MNQSQGSRRPPTSTPKATPVSPKAATPASSSTTPAKRQPPPPPPAPVAEAPPAAPAKPMFKAIYNFESQDAGEVSFVKDDIMEILEKDENGWWLAKKDGKEGWVPSNYLVEVPAAKPALPPALPAKRQPPAPPAAPAAPKSNNTPSVTKHTPVVTATERISVAATSNTSAVHTGFGGPGNVGGVPGWKVALEAKKAAAAAAAAGGGGAPAPAAPSTSPTPAARRPGPAVSPKPAVGAKPTLPARAPVAGPKPTAAARPSTGGKSLQEILAARRQQNED
ncbi:class II myosin [Entomortierella chlamydospora]|uniref:Class II myosin n=1 Tax=Entomortierella chlamydospora TaxID=101097 RepID=A0A9P6STN6_9FUNG|nr:class II myosin [Entomortierella chlamydospora]